MNEYYNTNIQWIDSITIPDYAFILLWSKRRWGKWVLCRNLLKKITTDFDIDAIIVFWRTAALTKDFDFIEQQYIYDYDETAESKIKKIIEYQKKNIKSGKTKNIIILFDDITLYKENHQISNLASLGRHLKIFVIMSCQHAKKIVST